MSLSILSDALNLEADAADLRVQASILKIKGSEYPSRTAANEDIQLHLKTLHNSLEDVSSALPVSLETVPHPSVCNVPFQLLHTKAAPGRPSTTRLASSMDNFRKIIKGTYFRYGWEGRGWKGRECKQ